MEDIFHELSLAVKENRKGEIVGKLDIILKEDSQIKLPDVYLVKDLLKLSDTDVVRMTLQVIAGCTRHIKKNREVLTDERVVRSLLSLMESTDSDLQIKATKALSHICAENGEASVLVEKGGVNIILALLEADHTREDNALTTNIFELLVNTSSTNDSLAKTLLKKDILEVTENLLSKNAKSIEDNKHLLMCLLSVLSILADYFEEQNIVFKNSLCLLVIDVFKKAKCVEIWVPCLEIFHSQVEKDDIKLLLASNGVCEFIYELIDDHTHLMEVENEDHKIVFQCACDIIVITLTEDECMNLLYNNGVGKMYKNVVSWLSTSDEKLLSTAVLALGNFARKDLHCIEMVSSGISKKLIELIKKYNESTRDEDVKIQHALLSTLKNLVIPPQNKSQVLGEGLIDAIYPMIKMNQYLVIFKLLGTFRMVIDGQEKAALDLISRQDFLERLVFWCYNSDHLGIRGEVPRLISWLIKNCRSFKPFKGVLDVDGCVKCIVEMICSNHAVMQNEAFIALSLMCTGCKKNDAEVQGGAQWDQLVRQLVEADIGKSVSFVLMKYGHKMDRSSIENLLTLLEQLFEHSELLNHLKEADMSPRLITLTSNPNAERLKERIDKIVNALKVDK
nr:unnamed protein product [Callosobruchus analis]